MIQFLSDISTNTVLYLGVLGVQKGNPKKKKKKLKFKKKRTRGMKGKEGKRNTGVEVLANFFFFF